MNKENIQMFCGCGQGKTSAALGKALMAASENRQVIIIQFLKSKNVEEETFLTKLEPNIKFFRFEKAKESYDSLTDLEKAEEIMNIKNGINFAKKVLSTDGCDVLVLDEVLGLVDEGVLSVSELISLIEIETRDIKLILTGIKCPEELLSYAGSVSRIEEMLD